MTLLEAADITVKDGAMTLVRSVSLCLAAGEPLVVLGETGSGKSLLAQAIMGTLPPGLAATGRVLLHGRCLDPATPAAFRGLWGRELAVLPQEPWLALDPLMQAVGQVAGPYRLVRGRPPAAARQAASRDLAALGLGDALAKYPHQLSGGMAQRVAIAAARAGGARIVIADEPTKGLDSALRDEVADLLLAALEQGGGLLVITHDLALARRIGGQMLVLRGGEVVEAGATTAIVAAPAAAYTRALLAADPTTWQPRSSTRRAGEPVVAAERLAVARGGRTLCKELNFAVAPGEILGVTGPSGCGKSSLGDVVLGLLAPQAGRVRRAAELGPIGLQKLYQDPVAAFPRLRPLGLGLADVARRHGCGPARLSALLERLNLDPALLERRPDAVSGGELQRLSLVRILLLRPGFIFADEPTSRLDPLTQADLIRRLAETADQDGCAIMLVSHDQALVEKTADRCLVLGGSAPMPGGVDKPQPARHLAVSAGAAGKRNQAEPSASCPSPTGGCASPP